MIGLLIQNILPLYILIALGYIGARTLAINLKSIARIIMFMLLPFVTFGAIAKMTLDPAYLLLPVILYGISFVITVTAHRLAHRLRHDRSANLVGAGSANGNVIYFGLPLVIALFGPAIAGPYLFMNIGPQVNNLTLAYYISARGKHDLKHSLKKAAKFPAIHATWLGLLVNVAGWTPPDLFTTYWQYAAGSLTILGMMMIGIALAKLNSLKIDIKLISGLLASKFIAWPALAFAFVLLDQTILGLYDTTIHHLVMIFSAMPLMGNLVAYAAEYDLYPEKAAAAVLISTLLAIAVLPLLLLLLGL
jgi:hypothetical protein